jgi:hypothetical protein
MNETKKYISSMSEKFDIYAQHYLINFSTQTSCIGTFVTAAQQAKDCL